MHDLHDSRTLPSVLKTRKVDWIRHIEWLKRLSDTWISQSGDFRANDRRQTKTITYPLRTCMRARVNIPLHSTCI